MLAILEFLFWCFVIFLVWLVIAWVSDNIAPSKDDTKHSYDSEDEHYRHIDGRDF